MTHDGHPDYPSRKELKDQRRAKMEVSLPMRPAVQLLLDRMDSHPQEWWMNNPSGPGFDGKRMRTTPTRLQMVYNEFHHCLNSLERRTYEKKLNDIRMDEMHHWAMQALLTK